MRRALPALIAAVVLASGVWLSPVAFAAPAPASIDTLLGGLVDDLPLPSLPRSTGVAHQPFSVTVGARGRLYVADPVHHVVRFVHQEPCDGFCVGEDVFAGNQAMGIGGDGGDATKAQLAGPYAVAEDPQTQDVYIADTYGHQVRKVTEPTAAGAVVRPISTIAGTGVFGFNGDGSDATKAQLDSPYGIAFWRNPAAPHQTILYVADTLNNRIRVVYLGNMPRPGLNGTIATIAGTGDAGDGGDGGPALSARLNTPRGLAIDPTSGALFIADTFNNRVRRLDPTFDPSTGAISTSTIGPVAGVAGKQGNTGDGAVATSAQLNSPAGVALSQIGLLIADTGNNEIRVVSGGIISKFAGAGAPAATPLSSPFGVAAVAALGPAGGSPPPNSQVGDIFIADTGSNLVRIVAFQASGTVTVSPYAGNGTPGLAAPFQNMALDGATAVVQDVSTAQRVRYVLDSFNHSVREADAINGFVVDPPLIGSGMPGSTKDGVVTSNRTQQLHLPLGIALVPPSGEFGDTLIYVADTFNNAVRLITVPFDGTPTISTVAGTGRPGFGGEGGDAAKAQLSFPTGLAVDAAGNLFIADTYNARIRRVDVTKNPHVITTVAGTGTLGSDGDAGPATQARLFFPLGVATDPAGDLFIADSHANTIRRVDARTQSITTIAGSAQGTLNRPWGIAFDGFGGGPGTLLISDFLDHVVRVLDLSNGKLTILAGTAGTPGFAGDPGAPVSALLDGPRGVMVAPDVEEILIADSFSNRVRVLGTPGFGGPATLDLGVADRTTFPEKTAVITNIGTGILEIGSVTLDPAGDPGFGAAFFPSCLNARLAFHTSCSHLVDFVASGRSNRGTLILHDRITGIDHRIALQAEVPAIAVETDQPFPDTIVGLQSSESFFVTNSGTAPLKISGFTVSGTNAGDFTLAGGPTAPCPSAVPFTVQPGQRCEIKVVFTPGAVGPRSGTLTIAHNVPGSDSQVSLHGTGLPQPPPR